MLRFLCLLVLSTVIADRATYHNYQVRRVVPENQEQLKALQDLEAEPNGVSILVLKATYIVSEIKEVINAQLFTNRRITEPPSPQKFSFIQYFSPLSLVVTTNKQLILINYKIRQYEKIILCDQLMLNYCRTPVFPRKR